ncbi:hypothetical protein BJV77DRAFT_1061678 [Russula vinacea]|nr:hypothetical protein BJV77DRAFT_1061678 [Russula vinacea]
MAATEDVSPTLCAAQEAYVEQKDRLLGGLGAVKSLISDIRVFNKDSWTIRYPRLRVESSPKLRGFRHYLSFADDPSSETDITLERSVTRSLTLASILDARENDSHDSPSTSDANERSTPDSELSHFQVLRLDLNLGSPGSSVGAGALVSQLEKVSIANLVDERMAVSAQHIDRLRVRVEDMSSKVLVTGDVNAGKSTFVNALLRREVMPIDQQPCTAAFCEVHDFSENGNVEEVHVVKDPATYKIDDESTYQRASLDDLQSIMDSEKNSLGLLKLYLHDSRPLSQSLLNNGVVDISLIDAPGLNRDSFKTTALFSRQEEIDIVVFVVSAENHLTESARSFLRNASNEKAYLFIVVNKFDQIKDKEKCRRLVLDQIREVSPRSYDDANDLVHFVDSLVSKDDPSFEDLEASLRSFVLGKRAKSKLNPASTYLSNLLSDIELLVGDIVRAKGDLDTALPVLERMKSSRQVVEDALEAVEEQGTLSATSKTKRMLTDALDRVAEGLPGVESSSVQIPSYPGLLNIWDYARDVRRALLASLDMAVKDAEDEARIIATAGVQQVLAIRSRRVFMPEAMFSTHRMRNGKRKIRQDSIVVAGGMLGLGIGLATRPEMIQPTFFDLLDVPHHFWVYCGDGKENSEDESGPSALSIMSVGIGVVTMIGGQAIGIRAFVESAVRIADVLSHENARSWAAPAFGAIVMGATAYFVLELPSSVPRTVGRRIRNSLIKPELGTQEEPLFVDAQAARVARETRKVLRLAAWDLKERLRVATEERSREVRGAEDMERRAVRAKEWTADIREQTGMVTLS